MKHLNRLSCSIITSFAFLFPQASLGENSASGYFKSRQQAVQPINDIQAMLIQQIDSDTSCHNLTPTILIHYDNSFDKKVLKGQAKKVRNHNFKLTRKESSKRHAVLHTQYMRVIVPERQGELTNYLNVEVIIKQNKQSKCTHFYSYTLDNGIWKTNGQTELDNTK